MNKFLLVILIAASNIFGQQQPGFFDFYQGPHRVPDTSTNPPVIPDHRIGLLAEWWADSNFLNGEWTSTIDTLTARWEGEGAVPEYATDNGIGCIYFRGNSTLKVNAPDADVSGFTLFAAYRMNTTTGDQYLTWSTLGGFFSALNALSYGPGEFDGSAIRSASNTYLSTDWIIIAYTPKKIFINGTEVTYAASNDLLKIGLNEIGGRTDSGFHLDGYISVLRYYGTTLDNTKIQTVFTKLNSILNIY